MDINIEMYKESLENYRELVCEAKEGRYDLTGYDLHVIEAALTQYLQASEGKADSPSEKDLRVCEVVASFSVRKCNEFPPKSDWFDNNTSEKVFAKCKTIHGKITNDVVVYDFNSNKWRFMSPGSCEVIEWYDQN